tara:strand:+ start:539 stop:1183 length:645 start_codon:yes stop_codon:yes gene_type:complete
MACDGPEAVGANDCHNETQLTQHCSSCRQDEVCSRLYDIEYHESDDCTGAIKTHFSRSYLIFYNNTYNRGFCGSKKEAFCDTRDAYVGSDSHFTTTLYSVYGPACKDGEVFKVYASQNGYCYCGDGCNKDYNNPLLDYLLGALIGLLCIHILFNFSTYWHKAFINAKDGVRPTQDVFRRRGLDRTKAWNIQEGVPMLGGRSSGREGWKVRGGAK